MLVHKSRLSWRAIQSQGWARMGYYDLGRHQSCSFQVLHSNESIFTFSTILQALEVDLCQQTSANNSYGSGMEFPSSGDEQETQGTQYAGESVEKRSTSIAFRRPVISE